MKIILKDSGLPSEDYRIEGNSYALVGNESEIVDIATVEKRGLGLVKPLTKGWRDKKCVYNKLKALIHSKMTVTIEADAEDDTKYALLTPAEQSIALHWFILGKESWQLVLGDDIYWSVKATDYREWTMKIRKRRIKLMEAVVFRRMLYKAEAKDVLQMMDQVTKDTNINIVSGVSTAKILVKSLKKHYIEGIDGSVEDDGHGISFVGLSDFIDSRSGTPFATNGFRNLTGTFRAGHTPDSVADELINIKDGKW